MGRQFRHLPFMISGWCAPLPGADASAITRCLIVSMRPAPLVAKNVMRSGCTVGSTAQLMMGPIVCRRFIRQPRSAADGAPVLANSSSGISCATTSLRPRAAKNSFVAPAAVLVSRSCRNATSGPCAWNAAMVAVTATRKGSLSYVLSSSPGGVRAACAYRTAPAFAPGAKLGLSPGAPKYTGLG